MKIMLLAACPENSTFVNNKGVMLTNFKGLIDKLTTPSYLPVVITDSLR